MSKRKQSSKRTEDSRVIIPERDTILSFLRNAKKPRKLKDIAHSLNVKTSDERAALNKRLKAMLRDGQLMMNRREGYGLVDKMDLIPGRVIGHRDGYGFLKPDAGGDDLFIPARDMRSLLHGDHALVRMSGHDRRGREKVALVEVLERANVTIVGRLLKEDSIYFVVPDNNRIHQDIFIPRENIGKAKSGQYVVVEIVRHPDQHTQPVGKVIELLDTESVSELATEIAIRAYEIPHEWPTEVMDEIAGFKPDAKIDVSGRKDLRDLPFVTIDGEDARDFDDAVYCEPSGKGWRLLVAIADVSHYVLPDTALDEEAKLRGTSVYFPERVVPMLHEILSNELCSLKPEVDRYCLVCELSLNGRGEIKSYHFHEAVIRSAARMTYSEVTSLVLSENKETLKQYRNLLPHIENLFSLYKLMHKHRQKGGLLDFDSIEAGFIFDEAGNIEEIKPLVRNDAHRLIEEFMLAANIAAAEFLLEKDLPILFRNHETPKQEKLRDLREFLRELALDLGGSDEPEAKHYAALIDKVHNREDAHLIETVLLRSMPLAFYGEENQGHFGLAFDSYTHFTSPIRRYPDLLVHRGIRSLINKRKKFPYTKTNMHVLGESCSMTERRAEEATREVVQRLKCIYMHDKVGEVFYGTVSSVTGFGLFVELDDIFIEGLIHVTSLPNDYYHFDAIGHRLEGENSRKVYNLAQRLKVQVIRVDIDDSKIDFELVEEKQ